MSTCQKITSNILYTCQQMVAGIKDKAYLINIDDIDKDYCSFDADNPLLLTELVLKTGGSAYYIEGHNYSNEHDTALVKSTYYNSWEHNFIFRIFDNTPDVKEWIKDITEARFAIVIENLYSSASSPAGQSVFEVLGWDYGLEVKECTRVAADAELAGGWKLTAGCSDTLKESKPPLSFFYTSVAATRAALEELL